MFESFITSDRKIYCIIILYHFNLDLFLSIF